MVVSLSAADNKWAVKVGECSTTAWDLTTQTQRGVEYLQVGIDTITYDYKQLGLADQAAADAEPINIMGLTVQVGGNDATLGALTAYVPPLMAYVPPDAAVVVPGTYRWPLLGLLPRAAVVHHRHVS
jgi:hypothetical protein